MLLLHTPPRADELRGYLMYMIQLLLLYRRCYHCEIECINSRDSAPSETNRVVGCDEQKLRRGNL